MAGSLILWELTLIIGIAAVLALLGRFIKQPTLIAYLLTGILIGPLFFDLLHSAELIEIFAHMGIAFLLFIVGLSLDFRVLKEVGLVSLVAGTGQVLITSVIGYFIAISLGLAHVPALYIAAALAFSSTVVVVKLLSDKGETDTLHGKISIGILIVQDFIAAIALMMIPLVNSSGAVPALEKLLQGLFLVVTVFLFSHLIIPRVLNVAAKSQEVLFLFSLGWALMISVLFSELGFSVEIGALIAGMTLASSKFSLEISSRVKGLREFFVIIHLVFFGSLLVGPITYQMLTIASILSALVLLGNPIIIMAFMKMFGYKKQTSFLTGISIAQISEFSLILLFVGFTLGAIDQSILSTGILIALITIALSSYSIYYSRRLYNFLSPSLKIFDSKGKRDERVSKNQHYDIILFGYNRIGYSLLKALDSSKKKYLVVDYNPKTIDKLTEKGVQCIYGDANDYEFVASLPINKAEAIISTIPDLETNETIFEEIKNDRTMFLPTAHTINDAKALYELGADYVIMPHFLGGEYIAQVFLEKGMKKDKIFLEKKKHLQDLHERLKEGHDHPKRDNHGE